MLACELKGHQFDSQSGHMSGFWVAGQIPSWGCVQEATDRCISLTHWCFFFFKLVLLFIYFLNLYCIFFHYHLLLLCPPPPSNHHTVVHIHESFFLFALSLGPLTLPLCVLLLSIYESSPFSLLVQFVHLIPHVSEVISYFSFSD